MKDPIALCDAALMSWLGMKGGSAASAMKTSHSTPPLRNQGCAITSAEPLAPRRLRGSFSSSSVGGGRGGRGVGKVCVGRPRLKTTGGRGKQTRRTLAEVDAVLVEVAAVELRLHPDHRHVDGLVLFGWVEWVGCTSVGQSAGCVCNHGRTHPSLYTHTHRPYPYIPRTLSFLVRPDHS